MILLPREFIRLFSRGRGKGALYRRRTEVLALMRKARPRRAAWGPEAVITIKRWEAVASGLLAKGSESLAIRQVRVSFMAMGFADFAPLAILVRKCLAEPTLVRVLQSRLVSCRKYSIFWDLALATNLLLCQGSEHGRPLGY